MYILHNIYNWISEIYCKCDANIYRKEQIDFHCVVCSSSIYGFWLLYLQTLLTKKKKKVLMKVTPATINQIHWIVISILTEYPMSFSIDNVIAVVIITFNRADYSRPVAILSLESQCDCSYNIVCVTFRYTFFYRSLQGNKLTVVQSGYFYYMPSLVLL